MRGVQAVRFRFFIVGSVLLSLFVSGCASLPGADKSENEFEPSVQAELLRKRKEMQDGTWELESESKPMSIEAKLMKGDGLRRDGEYAPAMWAYLQAHEMDPTEAGPVERMASLHLLNDTAQAESMFRDLIEEHPESVAAHTGLGLALMARGNWQEAKAVLTRAIEFGPDSPIALGSLGVTLDRMGEFDLARDAYRTATDLLPNYYEAWNNLGVSYLSTQEFEDAAATLERAARVESRDPAVLNNLGLALGRLGRYDEALDAFLKAGTKQVAQNNLGYVAYLNGDYDRALMAYETALLEGGDDRLQVLRNFVTAQKARDSKAQ